MNNKLKIVLTLVPLLVSLKTQAALITHTPLDAQSAGVAETNAFGSLAVGGSIGGSLINFGVDYSFGNTEGYFSDPPLSFCGINGSNDCDLLTTVDARIVLTGSTTQGLTDFIQIEAGSFDEPTNGILSVFDINNNLLANVTGVGIGSAGSDLFTVSRSTADIAFFAMSGLDTFGVNQGTIESATGVSAVPAPAAVWLFGSGLVGLIGMRKKSIKSIENYA